MSLNVTDYFYIISLLTLLVGAYLTVRSTTVRATIQAQAVLIDTQGRQIEALKEQTDLYVDNNNNMNRQIGELQGQIKVLKELPLERMADLVAKTERENIEKFKILDEIFKMQQKIVEDIHCLADNKITPSPRAVV